MLFLQVTPETALQLEPFTRIIEINSDSFRNIDSHSCHLARKTDTLSWRVNLDFDLLRQDCIVCWWYNDGKDVRLC